MNDHPLGNGDIDLRGSSSVSGVSKVTADARMMNITMHPTREAALAHAEKLLDADRKAVARRMLEEQAVMRTRLRWTLLQLALTVALGVAILFAKPEASNWAWGALVGLMAGTWIGDKTPRMPPRPLLKSARDYPDEDQRVEAP